MILLDTQKREFGKLKDIRIFGKTNNESLFNGDLLVIGLGGVGCKVASNLKGMLKDNITIEDNISFLAFDSDIPAMEETIRDSVNGVGFNAQEVVSIYRPNIERILSDEDTNPVKQNVAKWMSPEFPTLTIGNDGAKTNRQIGRLMFSNAYQDVRILLFDKLDEMYARSQSGGLDVIIVSSVAGGTGSGIISDLTYNIRAYAKAMKYHNLRVGGCLLMPDVLFGTKIINDNNELKDILKANGCATLKEISHYMNLTDTDETYSFECFDHKLTIKENIFDACMLVSGRKDELGLIPSEVIYTDTSYFLYKLATKRYTGSNQDNCDRKLLRDAFLEKHNNKCVFKIVNEIDYRVPVREIENICEYEVFSQAWKELFVDLYERNDVVNKIRDTFKNMEDFLNGRPGEPINLYMDGLIKMGQFGRTSYKAIKKNNDEVRWAMGKQLSDLKENIFVNIKSLKNNLWGSIDRLLNDCMNQYGPYAVIRMIGAAGLGGNEVDCGLIDEVRKLSRIADGYSPTGEFSRIIDSIKDIVAKRFFAFPSAKRETEEGYNNALVKETLSSERNIIMDGIESNDLFADTIRWLRERAEQLEDIYGQFGEDLRASVEELANVGQTVISYMLKDIEHHEFFPSDYVTNARVNEFRESLIKLLVDSERDINHGKDVEIKDSMERIYKNLFAGIGVYGPEKLLSVALSDKKLTLQDTNVMFVSPTNDRRQEIMNSFAKAFIDSTKEKADKKQLCIVNDSETLEHTKYIFLPDSMPYFSKALKELLVKAPYNEQEASILLNSGEIEMSIDDMFVGIPLNRLVCADDMQRAYDSTKDYKGLHIDEVSIDMKAYDNIA